MSAVQLEGMWLNAHIRELLEERDAIEITNGATASTQQEYKLVDEKVVSHKGDAALDALNSSLTQARKMVEAAQKAIDMYRSLHPQFEPQDVTTNGKGAVRENGVGSRELSGEMGGDTTKK